MPTISRYAAGRVRYLLRRYRGIALLRAAYWMFVRGYECEVCHNCGRPIRVVWWCYDDVLWTAVTGNEKPPGSECAAGTWCIDCFDEAAQKRVGWIEWSPGNLRFLQHPASQSKGEDTRGD